MTTRSPRPGIRGRHPRLLNVLLLSVLACLQPVIADREGQWQPAIESEYITSFPDTWWWDEVRAARIGLATDDVLQ